MRRERLKALGCIWLAAVMRGASASGSAGPAAESAGVQQADAAQKARLSPKPGNRLEDAQAAYRAGDYAAALRISRGLAEKGDASAQAFVGLLYAEGRGVAKDDTEASKWYRKAADQGYAAAQRSLGDMYLRDQGVSKDEVEAVKWFLKAAEQGDAPAQDRLGVAYHLGRVVARDDAEAVKWFRLAAEQEYASAQGHLGAAYELGEGVAKDEAAALMWFRKAADQGEAHSQWAVGTAYEHGRGVSRDYTEAMLWYRKAAEQGGSAGQLGVGSMYEHGLGVPRDLAEAAKWYRKAAEGGSSVGERYLGDMYAGGLGVPQDLSEARKWYRKAAAHGDREAPNFVSSPDALLRRATDLARRSGTESSIELAMRAVDLDDQIRLVNLPLTRENVTVVLGGRGSVTHENAKDVLEQLERERREITGKMGPLGFAEVGGDYDLHEAAKDQCKLFKDRPFDASGLVTMAQNGQALELKGKDLIGCGVIVGGVVVMKTQECGGSSPFRIVGIVTGQGIYMVLRNQRDTSHCSLGTLTRHSAK